jgi:hypothetical protein
MLLDQNYPESPMRGWAGLAITTASSLAVLPAAAQSPNMLCEFVKIVLSAKPDGFDLLKGEAQNPAVFHNEVFHGAVLPNQGATCTLFTKTQAGRVTLPPRYSCTIAQSDDFADANRIFQRAQQDLKACFTNLAFATKYDGDGKDPDDMFDWTATADQPSYRLALEMSNGLSALAAALSQNDPKAPRIAIDLDITDTSEEK